MLALAPIVVRRSDAWTRWGTIGVWATVVVYIVIAAFAWRQLVAARELRQEQLRPFVVAEFLYDFLITFRVKNYGEAMALNVRLRWDPWPVTTFSDDEVWKSPEGSVLFSRGIPFLPPGQELTALFDHFPNRVGAGLRMIEKICVDYEAPDGRTFSESYELDMGLKKGLRFIGRKDIDDIGKSLDKIETTLGRWTDGFRGLRVNTSNRDRDQRQENRSIDLTQARRLYRQQGAGAAFKYLRNTYARRHGWYFWD